VGELATYPVIMCGGSGTRLWPSSRPGTPKQFLPLIDEHSLLQETVRRVAPLAQDGGCLLIVAGAAHVDIIGTQLREMGAEAVVLAEPEPRDSAAAIAAAAAWIHRRHPDGLAVVVASDHHVPDHEAFRAAVEATLAAARSGSIVTLGVRPTAPATAYGYIRFEPGEGVRPLQAFVEKPDATRAAAYVEQGFLWNSGNFIASVATLRDEMAAQAPAILAAVDAALPPERERVGRLADAFRSAPKISFDYAVMEKTQRAAVLPVSFAWSDVGAWDAVWQASARDEAGSCLPPGAMAVDAGELFVRAPKGVRVAVVGVSGVAVVVEPEAVLVCALDRAQEVKQVAEAAAAGGPGGWALGSLAEAAAWFRGWLNTAALPVWATLGVDAASGGFLEALEPDGAPRLGPRRIRSLTRQVMVFALASADGRPGPWAETARRGAQDLLARGRRDDGLFVSRLGPDGEVADPMARLYEQAFALMALGAVRQAGIDVADALREAKAIRAGIEAFRHPAGAFREEGPQPFQANALMHLFEAAQMWAALDADGGWTRLADELAGHALQNFGVREGLLNEFYDAGWAALSGEAGLLEPGHHFEWAWLLRRWAADRGQADAITAPDRLYERGLGGVDARRGVAINSVWADFTPRDPTARLWPQTELLKAALAQGDETHALMAANTLRRYLQTPVRGVWRDRMLGDGSFVNEPAPATSFYHLYLAIRELEAAAGL
jgi:mannose-1-phosphate guanylyltransferase/mannose-6-phosphate isomerase